MGHLVRDVLICCGVWAVLVMGYLGFLIFQGWAETASAPRKPMYMCDVHGPLPMDEVIKFKDSVSFIDAPVCPICFHQRMSKAERGTYGR